MEAVIVTNDKTRVRVIILFPVPVIRIGWIHLYEGPGTGMGGSCDVHENRSGSKVIQAHIGNSVIKEGGYVTYRGGHIGKKENGCRCYHNGPRELNTFEESTNCIVCIEPVTV